jgi:uncharacterized membrane protein YuzA (DUF378 family)
MTVRGWVLTGMWGFACLALWNSTFGYGNAGSDWQQVAYILADFAAVLACGLTAIALRD